MLPFVSIIVPVKSEARYIIECVASLLNQDYPNNRYEIIIVLDKNATDAVKKALRPYSRKIKVLQSRKKGSAANRNIGTSKASSKAKYFAFTDADCIADKGWLKTLVTRMEQVRKSEKDIDVIGGLNLVPKTDNKMAKTIGAMEQTLLGGGGSAQVAVSGEEQIVPSLPNCNSMYRKELWKKNKQDENLIVGQDGEFNYRLSKQGVRFLAIPDAVVWHHRTSSIKGFVRRMFKYGEATARIWKKHKNIEFLRIRWYGLVPVAALIIFTGILIWSLFSLTGLYILAFVSGVYAAADILTAASVIQKTRMKHSIISLILLPLQHLMYALGFIRGIIWPG
ncbi:glycosyltransferase [Candidatus Woesearchaeota archaeon]|nr:glycosyltransferase [Candidatus Woesearchaeota archaeon]